jgi:hypothetical protein
MIQEAHKEGNVLRGFEETVQTVESTCHCLYCKMYLRCVLNDVSPYTTVKCPKYPRKERASLEKNTQGSDDRREQSIGRDYGGLGRIMSKFVPDLI